MVAQQFRIFVEPAEEERVIFLEAGNTSLGTYKLTSLDKWNSTIHHQAATTTHSLSALILRFR